MIVRTVFVLVLLIFIGCSYVISWAPETKTAPTPSLNSQPTSPAKLPFASTARGDSSSFDPNAHVAMMIPEEAAVVADYIGLSLEEAVALAKRQKRNYEIGSRDNKSLPVQAIDEPGRITFSLNDGIVTGAHFGCGLRW